MAWPTSVTLRRVRVLVPLASAPLALVPLAVVAAALVGLLGLAGSPLATPVGTSTAGLTALLSGPVLLVRSWGAGPHQAFRRWLGWAVTVWGVGQAVQGIIAINGTPSFPTAGDLLSLLAAPLAFVGALLIPRRCAGRRPVSDPAARWRLPVDSALISVTAALLVWQFAFLHIFTTDGRLTLHPDTVTAVVVMLADVGVTALSFLIGIRDLDRNMLLVSVGVGCYTVGDLVTLHTILHGEAWPWQGAMLWCLAWPLLALGLLRYRPEDAGASRARLGTAADLEPDARVVVVTTYTALALLALGVVLVIASTTLQADPVSLWFVVVALLVLAGREWLNTRMRSRLVERLHEEATTDPLTGLPNRRTLELRLAAVSPQEEWSLLSVDLDGFKEVNAVLGHPTGDRLLEAAAHRIGAAVPPGSLVSRAGGDEFAVLVAADVRTAQTIGGRLVAAVRQAAGDVAGVDRLSVSASVGIAAVAGPGVSPGSAVESSDPLAALSSAGAALRTAKRLGRDRVEVFDAEAARVRHRRLLVEERLRAAISQERIEVAFQPIVDLNRDRISGAEALARWTDPVLGVVDPGEFIPVAEESGLVVALGELVLHRTLAEVARHDLHGLGIRVSCNVSPLQLRVPGFHQVVAEALSAHGVPPAALVVEVTEAVFIEEDSPAVRTLRRLDDSGVTIAIDDFGTGYSALGYLRRLPVHVLKIDRSLTASLVEEPQARAITTAVLDLSRSLGVQVVVEGIESSVVSELVTRLGAGFGQGSMYGGAVPAAELVAAAARSVSVAAAGRPGLGRRSA
ncbi:MAG: bifunctional diguanylate cyclase/phosphodiesterase [Actinobacteria bacterium]|nr:bifunctional diguanylate cyclase/phosphodiesterase [Actinomycetota bacterium]